MSGGFPHPRRDDLVAGVVVLGLAAGGVIGFLGASWLILANL